MLKNANVQVATPTAPPTPNTRKTTRMARKGRVPICEYTSQKQMPGPAAAATTTTTPATKTDTKSKRCMRPGPLQRNPYLNFLREYRKKCHGLSAIETIRRGAQAWNCLTAEQKAQYIVQAFYTRKNNFKRSCYPADRRRRRAGSKRRRSRRRRRSK